MEINLLNTIVGNNSFKTNVKSKNQYNDFSNMLSKVDNSSNEIKSNSSIENNQATTTTTENNSAVNSNQKIDSNSAENKNSYSKVDNSKPVTQDVKNSLKDAGVSEDDLNKIKDLNDLKDYIAEKILKGQSGETVDINSLLAILATFMNGNFTKENMLYMKNKITEEIQTLADSLSKLPNVKLNDGSLEKIKQQIPLLALLSNDNLDGKSNLMGIQKEQQNPLLALLSNDNLDGKSNLMGIQKEQQNPLLALLSNDNLDNKNILMGMQKQLTNTDDLKIYNSILPEIQKELSSADTSKASDSILPKILGELALALNENSKTSVKDLKDSLSDLKLTSKNLLSDLNATGKNLNADQVVQNKKDNNDLSGSLMSDGNGTKKDEDFLKNLLSNSDDKISKVTNFMSQFNNAKIDNSNVIPLEDVVINKNNFNADMIKALNYMETNNLKDLTVKVMPKELGEVVINLTMESGVMKATITASNKEAYNILNSNLLDITSKLQNNDVKIQNLSLNIYNEDATFFKNGSQRQNADDGQKGRKTTNAIAGIGEENEDLDNSSVIDSNVDMLA